MKKIILTAAAVAMMSSAAMADTTATANWTANGGKHSIVNTKHNLPGNYNQGKGSATKYDQICIFCHTPHNSDVKIPLWNRNADATAGLVSYYNSPTLTSVAKTAGVIQAGTISSFCMSCHDGVTAMGNIKYGADTGINTVTWNGAAGKDNKRANLGTDMSNDHPVGFNYDDAQAIADPDTGINGTPLRLNPSSTVKVTLGNFLFGTNGTQMECASCHKVHDSYFQPFLRTTNNMSQLCLACHNK
jgi:predicted CXXCH cytochrome family protein